ncbi:MAG: dTMP kinase [Proteobacteria bacterium]|nr:dTMP kinase [Pseudomonadota bacterium]
MKKNGFFISFEGGEGCGKSTQSKLLHDVLCQKGYDVIRTREPGGTVEAEIIRELLVTGDPNRWDPHTEALLMFASRSEHFRRKIAPSLQEDKIVISDRFADSSFAYQGFARNLGLLPLKSLYDFAVGEQKPDITILLDIEPEIGILRTQKRNLKTDERFEKESLSFHQKVREGYLTLSKMEPDRFVVLDATKDVETLQKEILKSVLLKIIN